VVVYNFGPVQRTSQVEIKTKCYKKTMKGYSCPLNCLVFTLLLWFINTFPHSKQSYHIFLIFL